MGVGVIVCRTHCVASRQTGATTGRILSSKSRYEPPPPRKDSREEGVEFHESNGYGLSMVGGPVLGAGPRVLVQVDALRYVTSTPTIGPGID